MSFAESSHRPAGLASLLIALGYSGMALGAPQGTVTGPVAGPVAVVVPPAVRSMASKPAPPADAQKVTTIGTGPLQASTANDAGDTDLLWSQKIDINGDGKVEDAQLLWDNEDSILYLNAAAKLACAKGGEADASLLIVLYGNANKVQQATGSGAYVVQLDGGECGAKAAGLFGCEFDPKGAATACGTGVLDKKSGDLDVVAVAR